jgi:hypothetical protein
MFCRLKDWRRIATRYDKLATNFMAAICLAAAVTWWLWVRSLAFWISMDRSRRADWSKAGEAPSSSKSGSEPRTMVNLLPMPIRERRRDKRQLLFFEIRPAL